MRVTKSRNFLGRSFGQQLPATFAPLRTSFTHRAKRTPLPLRAGRPAPRCAMVQALAFQSVRSLDTYETHTGWQAQGGTATLSGL